MRSILSLAFVAALSSTPAGAQSVILPSDAWQAGGPNAQAARRPEGPNAQVAQRRLGPNAAIASRSAPIGGPVHYPSCAAAGAVRATPLRRGEEGYGPHLDPDKDGVACD
jgi:hypothetical protein